MPTPEKLTVIFADIFQGKRQLRVFVLDDSYFAKGALSDHAAEGKMVQANCRTISAVSSHSHLLATIQFAGPRGGQCPVFVPSLLRGAFADWFAPIVAELPVLCFGPELENVDGSAL